MSPSNNINRPSFFSSLSQFIDSSKSDESSVGLILIDIVNLSEINHSHGYVHGDNALQFCSNQLASISRIDNTVFRIGNRQFVFILPAIKTPSFVVLAMNKIVKVLQSEDDEFNIAAALDIKIGVALNKSAEHTPDKTLQIAETSLKKAKASDGYFNIAKPTDKPILTDRYTQVFREKLASNDFELYYQPQVNMSTGTIERAEALLRWQVPDEGFISPEVAVDIAARTGQSFALTKWVIHTAVRQIKQWEKEGHKISVAVNVQADLIQSPELVDLVKDSLTIWGVDRKQLTVEITESAVINDKEAGFDNLSKLKTFGVELSIDDFGTGYSSLSYFKHIPANELKIDQSFVRHLLEDRQDEQIVKIIIEIAKFFDLKLVAEGIEDQQTYDYLKSLGCDYGQGYHMAKPMPAEAFLPFIKNRLL